MSQNKFQNSLIHESSPYLLQHAHNPVAWFAWGEPALKKSQAENKPIFLSIGYSTCHWCHVMAHESFEDETVAAFLNEHFVSIKVDREERPDLDDIYMKAVMAITGSGGWPMTVFLTPALKPFFGGTYFPPDERYGRPSFLTVLQYLQKAWVEKPDDIFKSAEDITAHLSQKSQAISSAPFEANLFLKAWESCKYSYDAKYGGFGSAPKFASPHQFSWLLIFGMHYPEFKAASLEMVAHTLQKMAYGGIHDHLGGGFARYSTDARWFAPHFEKMLYDQAGLAKAYLQTFQITQNRFYAEIAKDILGYVLRDMTDPLGGFYSAEDADSEGIEGLFYIWKQTELKQVLNADEFAVVSGYFETRDEGNWEHASNILHAEISLAEYCSRNQKDLGAAQQNLATALQKLYSVRKTRIHPSKDDKVLCAWNGMMISAFCLGYQALGNSEYLVAATRAADFILEKMSANGKLLRSYRNGQSKIPAFMEDYAFFIQALLDLYESNLEPRWLAHAFRLQDLANQDFWDEKSGMFNFCGPEHETLAYNTRDFYDGAMPSENSVAALNLLRISKFKNDPKLEKMAQRILENASATVALSPTGFLQLLQAGFWLTHPVQELVIAANSKTDASEFLKHIHTQFLPNKILVGNFDPEIKNLVPWVSSQVPIQDKPTFYRCEDFVCQRPTTEFKDL